MAIIIGTNSWATTAEADTYLADRLDTGQWFELQDVGNPGEVTKTTFMVTAFRWLRNSRQLNLSDSLTDQVVKDAQSEAAFFLVRYRREWDDREAAIASGLTEFDMSRRSETFDPNQLSIPQRILDMLQNFVGGTNFVILAGEYDI